MIEVVDQPEATLEEQQDVSDPEEQIADPARHVERLMGTALLSDDPLMKMPLPGPLRGRPLSFSPHLGGMVYGITIPTIMDKSAGGVDMLAQAKPAPNQLYVWDTTIRDSETGQPHNLIRTGARLLFENYAAVCVAHPDDALWEMLSIPLQNIRRFYGFAEGIALEDSEIIRKEKIWLSYKAFLVGQKGNQLGFTQGWKSVKGDPFRPPEEDEVELARKEEFFRAGKNTF